MDERQSKKSNSNWSWVNPKPKMVISHLKKEPPNCEQPSKPVPRECICRRSKALVVCRVCAYTHKGRVRTECPAHPKTIYLMDIEQCPNCHGYGILREYPDD